MNVSDGCVWDKDDWAHISNMQCKRIREIVDRKDATIAALRHPLERDSYPCERCGVVYGLDASIPNSKWAAISTKEDGTEYGALCLWCMDAIAYERGVEFEAHLYFVGIAGRSSLYEGDLDERWPEIVAGRDLTIDAQSTEITKLREALEGYDEWVIAYSEDTLDTMCLLCQGKGSIETRIEHAADCPEVARRAALEETR